MGFQLNGACRGLIKIAWAFLKDGCGNIWQPVVKIPHKSLASLYPSRRYFQSVCGISPFLCLWKRITKSKRRRKTLPFLPFFSANVVLIRNFVLLPSAELLLFLCGFLNCPDAGLLLVVGWELFCIVPSVFWPSVKLITVLVFSFVVGC